MLSAMRTGSRNGIGHLQSTQCTDLPAAAEKGMGFIRADVHALIQVADVTATYCIGCGVLKEKAVIELLVPTDRLSVGPVTRVLC